MRSLIIIMLILFSKVSFGQISIDTTSYMIYDSITNSSTDWSKYLGSGDSVAGISIGFDTITKDDFITHKKNYHSKIDMDSSKVIWTDTSFKIKTKNWENTFNTTISDDLPWNYYKGFIEPLNFFLILNVDGKNELGILLLIDKVTGKQYFLSSGYDQPCESVFLSPKNNYLFSYANKQTENNQCAFSILKIDETKKHFKFKGFTGLEINTWTINDMAWINENSFALSVKAKTDFTDNENGSGIDYYLRGYFNH
jgi:hypothetical protein